MASASLLPPEGMNYIAVIEPALSFILTVTPLATLLVPILILLLLFSTPITRRHPVFILNVLAIVVGLIVGIINGTIESQTIIRPQQPVSNAAIVAAIATSIIPPLFIDSILLFRLFAFFPRFKTSTQVYVAVFTFPAIVKVARLTVIVLFLSHVVNKGGNIGATASSLWPRNPYMTTEWTLQMVDNAYCSAFFFWKLASFSQPEYLSTGKALRIHNSTLISRIRSLFLIALGNFVFPLFFNITQVVLIIRDPSYIHGTLVELSGLYINIFGVLFATVWASGSAWGRNQSQKDESVLSTALSGRPAYITPARPVAGAQQGRNGPVSLAQWADTTHPIQIEIERETSSHHQDHYAESHQPDDAPKILTVR